MRNLRKAALVAAMIGSLGMFGAGAASATGIADSDPALCNQEATIGDETVQYGLINVSDLPISILSSTNEVAQNQVTLQCSGGDSASQQQQQATATNDISGSLLDLLGL
ncbi:hypothetical protein ABZ070_28380 [Streptomyces sp. NPDC006283]|uniref:hypothetical protein n=1 Tax=Streptomyces sp. NPDC006283 TaxID=3156741 RepID=UPI0033B14F31